MAQDQPKSSIVWIIVAVLGVIGTIVASAIGAFSNNSIEKQRQEFELTKLALVSLATQGGATQGVLVKTVNAPSQTPEPTYTFYPTHTKELIVPMTTPASTNTPTATVTPSIQLPFMDDFDSGIRPEWVVVYGEPLIFNGMLSSVEPDLSLKLNDMLPRTNIIEFDYFWGGGGSTYPIITFGESIRFPVRYFVYCEVFKNNSWIEVAKGNIKIDGEGRLRFEVNNNNYKVFLNGNKIFDVVQGTSPSGSITVTVNFNRGGRDVFYIDNIVFDSQ